MPGVLLQKKLRSLESAAEEEGDFLLAVRHQAAAESFRQRLWHQRDLIAALVRHHFHLGTNDRCTVLPPGEWIQGGFNLCILVQVESRGSSKRLVFRCPMPHKLAEQQYPGTIDEKVACEVAVYAWMQEHCPGIRIPHLYAFGFANGSHVSVPVSLRHQLA